MDAFKHANAEYIQVASVERYPRPNDEEYVTDHMVRCLSYRRHLNTLAEERVSDGPSNECNLKVISTMFVFSLQCFVL